MKKPKVEKRIEYTNSPIINGLIYLYDEYLKQTGETKGNLHDFIDWLKEPKSI